MSAKPMVKHKTRKPITVLLIFAIFLSTVFLTGCTEDEPEVTVPVIVPEEQLMTDEYDVNDDITNEMSYYIDYISTGEQTSYNRLEIVNLFSLFRVQVDDMESVVMGKTTMGELAAIVDAANKSYVEKKTQALIDERQAIIDKEYEAAKEAALAAGKEFNQEKKEVRTDDISFEAPYTYQIYVGSNTEPQPYEATRLIDPSKSSSITFEISKYGIPYTIFKFQKLSGLYNDSIKQESDWVVNGVEAANVSSYMPSEEGTISETPSFVDTDGRNKAAKQNMTMTGNINFAGEGFTWDSLMTLCQALDLKENAYDQGYKKSSDAEYTYYTIFMPANIFETNQNIILQDKITVPDIRMVATFDPLTQKCVNWTLDMYSGSKTYSGKSHDLTQKIDVNVREMQVDTTDYQGMREYMNQWIQEHAVSHTHGYYAFQPGENGAEPAFGLVETGTTNITIEPVIGGTKYKTLEIAESNGVWTGLFVPMDTYNEAMALENKEEQDIAIGKKTVQLIIRHAGLDANGSPVGIVAENGTSMNPWGEQQETLYIVSQPDADNNEMYALTYPNISEMYLEYAKTYKLTKEQYEKMASAGSEKGAYAARQYVSDLFAAAEQAQKDQGIVPGSQQSNTENQIVGKPATTNENLNAIQMYGNTYAFQELDKNFFKDRGFSQSGYFEHNVAPYYVVKGDKLSYKGNMTAESAYLAENDFLKFYATDDPSVSIAGITVGMKWDEAKQTWAKYNPEEIPSTIGSLMRVKSGQITVILVQAVNASTEEGAEPDEYVSGIHMIYQKKEDTETDQENPGEATDPTEPTVPSEPTEPSETETPTEPDETTNLETQPGTENTGVHGGDENVGGLLGKTAAVVGVIAIVFCIASMAAMWKLFVKAGKPGWAAIVPVYNVYTLFNIGLEMPILTLSIIPFFLPVFVITMIINARAIFIKMGKSKNEGTLWALIYPITIFVAAFGNMQFLDEDGNAPQNSKQKLTKKFGKKKKDPDAIK